jgi:hypothetical protein
VRITKIKISTFKKTLLFVLCSTLAVMSAPRFANADITAELQQATRLLRGQATPVAVNLMNALRLSHNLGTAQPAVRERGMELLRLLAEARAPLNRAAEGLQQQDYDAYFAVAIEYYRIAEQLLIAREATIGQPPVRPLAEVTRNEIDNLRLIVPTRSAEMLRAALLQANRAAIEGGGRAEFPDLIFAPASGRTGYATLEFSPEARLQFGISALETFPSDALATDRLRMLGISTVLTHLADVERLISPSERPWFDVPSSLNSADQGFLRLQIEKAHRMLNEADFRLPFIRAVLPVLMQTQNFAADSAFSTRVQTLANTLTRNFIGHVDQNKASLIRSNAMADFFSQTVLDQNALLTIGLELVQTTDDLHTLEGDVLKAALRRVMVRVHGRIFNRLLGCFYFHDAAGENSTCFGGARQEQIYVAETGWSTEEVARLGAAVSDFLTAEYENIPDEVFAIHARIRDMSGAISAAQNRDQLAHSVIGGALALNDMDQTMAQIDRESGRTIVEEQVVAARAPLEQTRISPAHLNGLEIRADIAMMALMRAGFLQTEHPVREWYGEALSTLARRATTAQATDADRSRLMELIYGSNNFVNELDRRLQTISTLAGGLEEQIPASQEARAATEEDCMANGGLFSCIGSYLGWAVDFFNATREGETSRTAESTRPVTQPTLTIPQSAPLSELAQLRRQIRQNPGTSMLGLDREITEMKQRLQRSGTSTASSGHNPAILILNEFEELLDLAKTLGADALVAEIAASFDGLLDRSDMYPFVNLRAGVMAYREILQARQTTIQSVFGSAANRDRQLRTILRYRMVYMAYHSFMIQLLELRVPALFMEVTLPADLRQRIENQGSVPLYKIIASVFDIANTPLVRSQVEAAMAQARSLRTANSAVLDRTTAHGINMRQVLATAVRGMRDEMAAWAQIWRDDIGVNTTATAPDSWWPQHLTVGDVLAPAVDDSTPFLCEHHSRLRRDVAACKQSYKVARALTSSLLRPYLLAAHSEDRRAMGNLADVSHPVERALLDSRALRSMEAVTDGALSGGLARMRARATFAQRLQEEGIARLSSFNRGMFSLFILGQLAPQHTMPMSFHHYGGWALFVPAMSELAISVFLANNYRSHFLEMRDLGLNSVLPGSLVDANVMASMRDRFLSHAHHIQTRVPMDLIWMSGMLRHALMTARTPGTGISLRGGGGRGGDRGSSARATGTVSGESAAGGPAGPATGGEAPRRVRTSAPTARDYRILNLPNGETNASLIQRAYRAMIRRHHPDVNQGNPTAADARTAEINLAFDRIRAHLQSQGLWNPVAERSGGRSGGGSQGGTTGSGGPQGSAATTGTTPGAASSSTTTSTATTTTGTTAATPGTPVTGAPALVARTVQVLDSNTIQSFQTLGIPSGSNFSMARGIYRGIRARSEAATAAAEAEVETARSEVRRIQRDSGTEADLATAREQLSAAQERLRLLQEGQRTTAAEWQRVVDHFQAAGLDSAASY